MSIKNNSILNLTLTVVDVTCCVSFITSSLLNDFNNQGSSANYNKDVNKTNKNHYCDIRGTHQSTSSHDKKENENENRSSHTSTNLQHSIYGSIF